MSINMQVKGLESGWSMTSSNLSSCLLRRILYIHGIFLLAHPQIWSIVRLMCQSSFRSLGSKQIYSFFLIWWHGTWEFPLSMQTSFSTMKKKFTHSVECSTFSNTPCLTRSFISWWKSSCRCIGTFLGACLVSM